MTIKEYWNLIGQEEPFLATTWGPDFSQACSFPKMLMNLKNFRFTKNSRQNWWCDFLKNSKNPVFVPFLTIFGFFLKRLAVTHNYIWATNTILSFRKKLMSQFQENLWTNRRAENTSDELNDSIAISDIWHFYEQNTYHNYI